MVNIRNDHMKSNVTSFKNPLLRRYCPVRAIISYVSLNTIISSKNLMGRRSLSWFMSILLFNSFLIFLFFTAAANNLLKVFRNYSSLVSSIPCLLLFTPFVFILMNLLQRPSLLKLLLHIAKLHKFLVYTIRGSNKSSF